jgi:hypothetical protein
MLQTVPPTLNSETILPPVPHLPGVEDRLTIVGQTGSGKTHGALWQLSKQPIDRMPYVILNFKNEKLIDSIARARHIGYDLPTKPGIYVIHPHIEDEKPLNDFLWKLWERGNCGLYIDEGYMVEFIGAVKPLIAILTQGRTKHIPVITLVQRPVGVTRFIFSEAQYIQVFDLMDSRDYEVVENYMPYDLQGMPQLPKYNSWYFENGTKHLFQFKPVPPIEEIFAVINSKLYSRKI